MIAANSHNVGCKLCLHNALTDAFLLLNYVRILCKRSSHPNTVITSHDCNHMSYTYSTFVVCELLHFYTRLFRSFYNIIPR